MSTVYRIKKAHRESELNRQRRIALAAAAAAALLIWSLQSGLFGATSIEAAFCDEVYVTVRGGDSLWTIAGQYKPDGGDTRDFVRTIAAYNGIEDNVIHEGQVLLVPR